ncbi:MAG: hypothetical protein JW804_06185 [Sedimentisphaerales bacterium]|nr:hypothetical protein [Sedimentisphaerales bacterium]
MFDGLSSLCDDFYLDMCVNTELDLPAARDTVLTFFERIQKQYPSMGNFFRRGENEYCLEENQSTGGYRWISMETNRLISGCVNPQDFADACRQHKLVLELAPYMLSLSHLEVESLDVTFAMDFRCCDNHDEVITDALLGSSPFGRLGDIAGARCIDVSPAIVIALTEDNYTQARISIESKTAVGDPRRTREITDEAISLSLTVRQYPHSDRRFDFIGSFDYQWALAEELMAEKIMPHFARPLISVITERRLSHP